MLQLFLSHPIQHYVPWFSELQKLCGSDMQVVFASRHGLEKTRDKEFGESFSWDMDLLAGYHYEFYPHSSLHCSPNNGFWGIRFVNADAYLRETRPGAVMIFGWLFAGYWEVAFAAKTLGIPYILRAESNLLNRGNLLKWWVKRQIVGRLCRGAAFCLAVGQRNRELFQAYGVPDERIGVAPYFVDNDFFASSVNRLGSERIALRKRLGLPENAVVFLFMGKLIEKKHPDHVLQAWQSLPDELKSRGALLFGGSGAMFEELSTLARGDSRVVFAGFLNRNQLPEAYTVSDVLVLPSDQGETWGLVVNEAMASGLPAIVSDRVGCGPDLVHDGDTGYVYPFADIKRLSDIMAKMILESGHREYLGRKAAVLVREASPARAADAVVNALATITL
jgi:glycosyltransferase involved in cell wall biosynthesis